MRVGIGLDTNIHRRPGQWYEQGGGRDYNLVIIARDNIADDEGPVRSLGDAGLAANGNDHIPYALAANYVNNATGYSPSIGLQSSTCASAASCQYPY